MDKKIIENPFLGKIEVTKVGETSMSFHGAFRTDTIYEDGRGSLYIDTFMVSDDNPYVDNKKPMVFLRKEIVDIIKNLNTTKND